MPFQRNADKMQIKVLIFGHSWKKEWDKLCLTIGTTSYILAKQSPFLETDPL
jgi:hypothetical protein